MHKTVVCKCGKQLSTCRCASPNKTIVVSDKPCTHVKESEQVSESFPVTYWEEVKNNPVDSFWIKDAMTNALGQLWYKHFRKEDMPDTVTLTLDRETGIVTATAHPQS